MGILAKDLFEKLAPKVGDAGVCPDDEAAIIKALNEAIPLLIKRLDALGTIFQWCVPAERSCFGLPQSCLEVRTILLDGFPLIQRNQWYEGQLSVGQIDRSWSGGANCDANVMVRACSYQNCIDLGDGFATPTPWPHCWNGKIGFRAEDDADAGVEVLVSLVNEYGDERQESIIMAPQQQIVSSASFVRDIQLIRKPVTKGNIIGFFIGPNGVQDQIFTIPPRVMTPQWRRKKLPSQHSCGRHGTILIRGKIRFTPLVAGNDICVISDVAALQWACRALAAMDRDDRTAYNESLSLAVNELNKQLGDSESRATVAQAQMLSPFGRAGRQRVWS